MLQGYALLLNITLRTGLVVAIVTLYRNVSYFTCCVTLCFNCTVLYGPMLCSTYYVFVLCCIHDLFRIVIYCIVILLNIKFCVVWDSTDLRPFVYCNTSGCVYTFLHC